jgi:hypothetical protein
MQSVHRQPNSQDCFVCGLTNPVGLKLTLDDDGMGEVRLPDGSLAAEAALTLVDVPERMRAAGALDALGWKVYP